MPRLGYMIVDGLALALVGLGLTAVVVGYERNLPDTAEQAAAVAEIASAWADPETTGSIAPKDEAAVAAPGSGAWVDAGRRSPAGGGAWIDPPRR